MKICSCTGTSDRDLRAAVGSIRADDALAVVTPGRVYQHLGRKMRCAVCVRLVARLIEAELAALGGEPAVLDILGAALETRPGNSCGGCDRREPGRAAEIVRLSPNVRRLPPC